MELNGAKILFTIHTDIPVLGDLKITQTLVVTWIVMALLSGLAFWLGRYLCLENISKRQAAAEFIVMRLDQFVRDNMGPKFDQYIPLVGAIFALSVFCNLISVIGFWSPTADLNTELAWAVVVFILITYYKTRGGIGNYLREFTKPVVVLTPVNIIGEVATPLSMTLRHYGNILSGMVISTMLSVGLSGLSRLIFGWLPGAFGQFPFFEIGIPAVFSIYFDIFSGCLQAFIFAMLTMIYISNGFPGEAYEARMKRKSERIARRKQRQAEKTGVA